MVARSKPNEISITRIYHAPLTAVWEAWTDPEQVAKWWGPRGFTLTTHSKELRPGGIWQYTMHGPDGVDYPNKTVYHEVERCRKLVYDHGGNDDRPPLFRVTVLFSESAGNTTMEMTMTLPTAEEAAAMRKYIQAAGGYATWDRLAEFLGEEAGHQTFVITRTLAAPINLVFDMWTSPDHLPKWLPPAGFDMEILRADFRTGGDCFFRMSNRNDVTFYARFDFQEITPPNRIVYVQRFCDEAENPAFHPGLPVFPEALLTTIQLTTEDEFTTRATVTSEPVGAVTNEEIVAFLQTRSGMTQGWTGSFDALDSLISTATTQGQ